VERNMELTADEAKKFWPLYDAYQAELDKINTRQTRAMLDYVSSESSLTTPMPSASRRSCSPPTPTR
jgi:hypothetical protein